MFISERVEKTINKICDEIDKQIEDGKLVDLDLINALAALVESNTTRA